MSMQKNIAAQIGAPGNLSTTSGYVRKTSPGPLLTTASTPVACSIAMCPSIENVTQPASKEVSVLTTQVIRASLKKYYKTLNNSDSAVDNIPSNTCTNNPTCRERTFFKYEETIFIFLIIS